jgi:phenylacetate-coenzyme A ligase PaaK-like adenylate-forming protein
VQSPKPFVPDAKLLSEVQKLCDLENPYEVSLEADQLFLSAQRQIIAWHSEKSIMYRNLLKHADLQVSDLKEMSDLAKFPLVPAASFKEHEILSISKDQVQVHLTSSGTTGQKSQIFFDAWSLGSAQAMLDRMIDYYGWIQPAQKVRYLLYTYEPQENMKLGTSFTDHYLCKYAPADQVFYALRNDGKGGHEFDPYGCLEFLQQAAKDQIPLRIFGFPAFLYFTLKRQQSLGLKPFRLHEDSLVFLGGGWKGHADQAIDKFEFYSELSEWMGFRDERLKDGFGSVEHCIPYIECSKHHLHLPVYSRVLIRDFKTLKPLPYGQKGFLHFVSPYITSVPAHSVLMGDVAVLHAGSECGCELQTEWFEIQGRAGTSKNRSCAAAASELLKGRP